MRKLLATIVASSALVVSSNALAFDQQGSSTGNFVSLFDPTPNKTLLGGFWFDFSDSDHHLKTIGVVARTVPDRTFIHYNDHNKDDDFTYFVRQPLVTNNAIEGTYSVATSQNCQSPGLCRANIGTVPGHMFVLQGFYLSYESSDHHMNRIAVYESNGVLTIAFNDKNSDDYFGARVEYAWVPLTAIQASGVDSGHNDSLGYIDNVPAGGDFVIRGFDFDFDDSDHHLNGIGISRTNVLYADWNHDDDYRWNVRWATLRSSFSLPVIDGVLGVAP